MMEMREGITQEQRMDEFSLHYSNMLIAQMRIKEDIKTLKKEYSDIVSIPISDIVKEVNRILNQKNDTISQDELIQWINSQDYKSELTKLIETVVKN